MGKVSKLPSGGKTIAIPGSSSNVLGPKVTLGGANGGGGRISIPIAAPPAVVHPAPPSMEGTSCSTGGCGHEMGEATLPAGSHAVVVSVHGVDRAGQAYVVDFDAVFPVPVSIIGLSAEAK